MTDELKSRIEEKIQQDRHFTIDRLCLVFVDGIRKFKDFLLEATMAITTN